MFLDDDDLVDPRFVEQGLPCWTRTGAPTACSSATGPSSPRTGTWTNPDRFLSGRGDAHVALGRATGHGKPSPSRHPGTAPGHLLSPLPDPDQLGTCPTFRHRRRPVSRGAPAGRGHLLLDLTRGRGPPVRVGWARLRDRPAACRELPRSGVRYISEINPATSDSSLRAS